MLVATELSFLGIRVHPLTTGARYELIDEAVNGRRGLVIGYHNLHSLFLVHHDRRMADFNRSADHLLVDGMGLVLLGRSLGQPLHRAHRLTYADWIDPLCAEAVRRGWRLFHVGGRPGVGERAAVRLTARHPGLVIDSVAGYFDTQHDSDANRDVVHRIRSARPDVLLVGMGMPRQEQWVLENAEQVPTGVILTCGSCMDYVAGETQTPPRWAGRVGLEWLFRLASEPRRLSQRYLVEPWFVAALAVRERMSRGRK